MIVPVDNLRDKLDFCGRNAYHQTISTKILSRKGGICNA